MPDEATLPALRCGADVPAAWCDALQASLLRQSELLRPWGPFPSTVDVSLAATGQSAEHPFTLATADATRLVLHSALLTPDNAPDAKTLDRLLAHELAHVALFWRAGGRPGRHPAVPFWFREGLAELVARGRPSPATRALARRASNTHDASRWLEPDAATLTQHGATAYAVAAALFVQWFDQRGHRGLATLCRQLRGGAGFDAAFARVTGGPAAVWAATEWDAVRGLAAAS